MDRLEEYRVLLEELEQTPPALDGCVERAESRLRRKRWTRRVKSALGVACAVMLVFVVLVNTFPSFAYACGRIPLLRELAQVVAFSPSLSAAVDNQYVQPIEQEQSAQEITARVEYVIVDQKQVNIFYTLDSPRYQALEATPQITDLDGKALEGYSISAGNWGTANGELNYYTLDFVEGSVPQGLRLTLAVRDRGSWDVTYEAPADDEFGEDASAQESGKLCELSFDLHFDPEYTEKGEEIILNQTVLLDGQQLTLTTAEIYPTHIRVNFADVPENTAWLKSLAFYLENEKGQRFEAIDNGITATGSPDSPMMVSHRLESSYFSDSKHLTLCITQVTWLDKDMERVRLDLDKTEAQRLPQGVTFTKAEHHNDGWKLTFLAKRYQEHHSYQLWANTYYDESGKSFELNRWTTGGSLWLDEDGEAVQDEGYFITTIPLLNYPDDVVYLCPHFSRIVNLEQIVRVNIR